jgi:predicted aspartyl protease/tetratricopeptide (TPR) repeat protein
MGGKHFLGVLLAMALACAAAPASAACRLAKVAEAQVTMTGLAPVVAAKINGQDARLVVDSGAFFGMLTPDSARRLGLRVGGLPPGMTVRGVNGEAQAGAATAKDVVIFGHPFSHLDFVVGGGQSSSALDGWLGQNFLNALDVEYDLANGVIRLFKPEGCGETPLAYWSQGKPFSALSLERSEGIIHDIQASAKVNGAPIRVIFDTGAWRSILTTGAARRAGVRAGGPDVVPAGLVGGFGRRPLETWVGPFDSFEIGDEQIKNTRLRIGDIEVKDADMLLGADFFLSHRILVSNSQHKLYFTYNGGPVFRLDRPLQPLAEAQGAAAPPRASAAPSAAEGEEPKTAEEFARRAAASLARRDFEHAIADDSRAIELEPNEPKHLLDRAIARAANAQPFLAMADLDAALKLKPDFAPALLLRGEARLGGRDEAGARQDFEAAAKLDPRMRLPIAQAYLRASLQEPAIAELDQWIADHPKGDAMPDALNDRCWARALLGRDLDKALADCDAALRLMPHRPPYLDSRALVRLRLGQLDEAIADYDEALKTQPNIAWALYGRGVAKMRKGMKAEGEADIKAATAIAPRLPDQAKRYGVAP